MNAKSKKKKKLERQDQPVKETEAKQAGTDDNQQPNDYGGLPQRDLKKNLGGCG
jgi:hypothetical protein